MPPDYNRDMDALIRRKTGRLPAVDEKNAEPPRTSFDGGARALPPAPPPSLGAMMMAELEDHRQRVNSRAAQLARHRELGW